MLKTTRQPALSLSLRIFLLSSVIGSLFQVYPSFAAVPEPQETPAPQDICKTTVRVMPLGDSITVGKSSGATDWIAYRKDLWNSLIAANYSVDFVGSQINGDSSGFDQDHEGHGGYTDAQVATYIYNNDPDGKVNWLSKNPADVILLHIGTNSLDEFPDDVEDILNEIDQYEADTSSRVTVILARIIDRVPPSQMTNKFNNNVEAMAQKRIDNGDDIILADMEDDALIIYKLFDDPVTPGDMYNYLHPYHTGYTKMAAEWKQAIDDLYMQCNTAPVVTNPGNQVSRERDQVSLQIEALDPDPGDALTYTAERLPPGLSIDGTSGMIGGAISAAASQGSPYAVSVTVSDNGNPFRSTEVFFSWEVYPWRDIFVPLILVRKN